MEDACHYEIDALHKHDTWKLLDLPPSRNISLRGIQIKKPMAPMRSRLVARDSHSSWRDYDETFAPVATLILGSC